MMVAMDFDIGVVLTLLFVVVLASRLFAIGFEFLKLPQVVGEISIG